MSLKLTNVSKYYGKQKALDKVNFSLNEGEICGFLGPNGAGKSTTMKIIAGALSHYEGNVQVCDTEVRQHPLETKARIGYLPEHNPLYPDMYIHEYLLHVARLYHCPSPRQRVNEMIKITGLIPEARKKIGQLSKGYRQRVGLAQALIHDPQVLILDEPMTGLDPNQLEEIRTLIAGCGKNKTVLLSTHIMQEVEAICNRVIIINQGKIITDKPILQLQENSAMVLVVRFAPEANSDWLQETRFPGATFHQIANNYWQIEVSPDEDPRIDLFNAAAAHHCPIIELKCEELRLEEVFHRLTQEN